MSEKFEYYVGKYGSSTIGFDASQWGVRLFLGAILFAVAVMVFFWTWQSPPVRIKPTVLNQSEAPIAMEATPEATQQASSSFAVYYEPLTDPFTMEVGTVAQFMVADGLRCVLVTESPDQVISDFFKEVFTPCE